MQRRLYLPTKPAAACARCSAAQEATAYTRCALQPTASSFPCEDWH